MHPNHTTNRQSATSEKRFWAKVNKAGPLQPIMGSECWLWLGKPGSHGYGMVRINGISMTAHRYSWILHHGEIPKQDSYHGICVLHRCDNRLCVNPDHLFLGTQGDNMQDMSRKGRGRNQVKPRQDFSTTRKDRRTKTTESIIKPPRKIRQINRYNTKLTIDQVRQIKATLKANRISLRVIAKQYNVSHNTIWLIKVGKEWCDIE